MWSADVLAIHLASYEKWHFYLRSYGHTLPNFDGLLQFFFSMGPRYTRSLTNTISSTPMKINTKFFYLKFN